MSVENEAPPVDPAIDPDIEPPVPRDTRRVVGELIEPEKPDGDIIELSAQERADFSKLLTIGRRVKKVVVMDHPVTVRTLTTADEMRIGLYTKDYLDSQGFSRAYQVGTCAAGIVEIDGAPVYKPLSEKEDDQVIFAKSAEKLSAYYPIVISQIYDAIISLEREFADLAIKLGKIKG